MRREALEFLACPSCAASLRLDDAQVRWDGDHAMGGELVCTGHGRRFSIRDGVPVLLADDVPGVHAATAARFATEWLRWSELRSYYRRQFLDWVAPLSESDFAGAAVFEGGCGKGRHTVLASEMGARAVVAIDLGESAHVAFAHTRALPNVHIALGDSLAPPVQPVFDVAFSVGVLHHLPGPAAGFRSLAGRVKPGGKVAAWVYGAEGNAWITKLVDPLRKTLTSRVPAELLRAASLPPSALLWGAIKLLYKPRADGHGPRLPYGDYFASMHEFPLDEIHSIVFDQLVTPVAHYLPGDEVRRWFAEGFADVTVRSHRGYSWTGVARRV